MNVRCLLVAGLAVAATASGLNAQSSRIALIPTAGYALGYTLADDPDWSFDMKGAVAAGLAFEFTLNKNVGITVSGLRTVGQKLEVSNAGSAIGEADAAQTMLGAGVVIRPMGRLPSGAPSPLFIEAGAGINMWSFGNFIVSGSAFPADDFNASKPYGYAGAGAVFPIGPRAQLLAFGRANFITAYGSQGLDDFNAQPPASTVEGSTAPSFLFGLGLRVGR
jgi:hypothetical protein